MGLSANQVLSILFKKQDKLNVSTENINSLSADKRAEESSKTGTETKLNKQYSEQDLLEQQNKIQTDELEEYHQLLSETIEDENPMNKMYCGIKEFVIEEASMCGMGMGMGSLQLNSDLQLTGAELLAMDKVLNENYEENLDASGLVDKLHEMGIENAQVSSDSSSIELTRVDENGNETKVKIKDANGDGMLNGCDYDFSDALSQFNEDLKAYNQKITELENNINCVSSELEMTQSEQDKTNSFIDFLESVKSEQEKTIETLDKKLSAEKTQSNNLKNEVSDLQEDYSEAKNEEELLAKEENEEAEETDKDKKKEDA